MIFQRSRVDVRLVSTQDEAAAHIAAARDEDPLRLILVNARRHVDAASFVRLMVPARSELSMLIARVARSVETAARTGNLRMSFRLRGLIGDSDEWRGWLVVATCAGTAFEIDPSLPWDRISAIVVARGLGPLLAVVDEASAAMDPPPPHLL